MSVSAPTRYPNLQGMMDLFRSSINDDGSGADGPQGGIIATNDAAFTLPFLNAGIRYLYRKLRNVGDPALIIDNYLVRGLPALTQPDPAVQVSLGFLGYFDGYANHGQWTLPAGAMGIDELWERVSGQGTTNFHRVHARPNGLAPRQQGATMREYEWRGNALWMPGALQSVDLRIRCKIALPPILDPTGDTLNFESTYVPVLDADDVIVDYMLWRYARRFSPEQIPDAKMALEESMLELQKAVARQGQRMQNQRADFGEEAAGDFAQGFCDL